MKKYDLTELRKEKQKDESNSDGTNIISHTVLIRCHFSTTS